MSRLVLILCFFQFLLFCGEESPNQVPLENKDWVGLNDYGLDKYALIDSAINYGDELAYNEVSWYAEIIEEDKEAFFLYSFIFASKFNGAEAYYDLYATFVYGNYSAPLEVLNNKDSTLKYFALFNLLRAYELGFPNAKNHVTKIFGDTSNVPKSILYWEKYSNEVVKGLE